GNFSTYRLFQIFIGITQIISATKTPQSFTVNRPMANIQKQIRYFIKVQIKKRRAVGELMSLGVKTSVAQIALVNSAEHLTNPHPACAQQLAQKPRHPHERRCASMHRKNGYVAYR